jgi:hypothetical protein
VISKLYSTTNSLSSLSSSLHSIQLNSFSPPERLARTFSRPEQLVIGAFDQPYVA